MFAPLLLKELRDHFLSLRFQVGFLLALVLVAASAFVLSTGHERELRDLTERQWRENDVLARYGHLNRAGMMIEIAKPPAPLVLVRGIPADPPETLDGDPMAELFPPVDLASIVGVIFSLFAIVLGFDAINGERERGTIRLVLANGIRRFEVLAAKWAGGMTVLSITLAAALASGYAIVLTRASVHWTVADRFSAAALYLVPLAYCGAFFSLALALSAIARRSTVSVVAAVFAWLALVLVVPNVSPYVAARIIPVPSRAALERDLQYITSEERDQLINIEVRKFMVRYAGDPDLKRALGEKPDPAVERRLKIDGAFRQAWDDVRKNHDAIVEEVNRKQGKRAERLRERFAAISKRESELSRRISYASPLPPLVYALSELAVAGPDEQKRFETQAAAYDKTLGNYEMARYREELRKNPLFGYNDFLDLGARPRFVYRAAPFSDRLESALPYAAMLAAWNALFVFAGVIAFVRFDVR